VAQVTYTGNALANPERAFEFLAREDASAAAREAVASLARHPLIGRPVDEGLRELVISFGKTGYVALYRHLPQHGEVRVLALRHQRELDCP
jgi:plasmid stabilization system protein ParE